MGRLLTAKQPSGKTEWETPPELIAALLVDLGLDSFDLDAAAQKVNAKAAMYYGPDNADEEYRDGLAGRWWGNVWLNPPYGLKGEGYGLLPLALLKRAEFVIERIALLSDGCGYEATSANGVSANRDEGQGDSGLVALGDQEWQHQFDDLARRLAVDPPSPGAALVQLTDLLAANATNPKKLIQILNRRLMNHLNGQGQLIVGRPLVRATRGSVQFTVDSDAALTVDNASRPGQPLCSYHDIIIPQLRGLINDIAIAPTGVAMWARKARAEVEEGHALLVAALLPVNSSTRWWHRYVMQATEIRLLERRVTFVGEASGAPFENAIIIWRRHQLGRLYLMGWNWPRS